MRGLLHTSALAPAGVALQLWRPTPGGPAPRVGDGGGGPLLHRVHLPPTPSPQLLHIRELLSRHLSSAPPDLPARPLAGVAVPGPAHRHVPAPSRGTPGIVVRGSLAGSRRPSRLCPGDPQVQARHGKARNALKEV